ncbi:family 43 glycosylhydrolase [Streptomyces sp. ISL-99]|nr:family 43 glycosylhydrolase [Streptomyces sp. ISL-99]
MVHWKDHGVILDLGPDIGWADGRAWAPTMTAKNGKYYFYYSADTNIGVAVSDQPTGPFKDPLGKPLIPRGALTGQMIDPAVFTDDDGKSYLYWGNGRAYVVPLNDDMVTFDASKVTDITPSGYNEGTFVIKRNGTYYLMWSENDTRDENYRVAYATGSSPTGPWTKRGLILEKDLSLGIKGPGHHSVVQVPNTDDWYIAYHRFAIPGGDGTHRETTIDRMEFDSGGPDQEGRPHPEQHRPGLRRRHPADEHHPLAPAGQLPRPLRRRAAGQPRLHRPGGILQRHSGQAERHLHRRPRTGRLHLLLVP